MQSIEAGLLLSELIIETGHPLVAFPQGLGKVADLLLKLVHALHVAWTIIVSAPDKDAPLRRSKFDTHGFESLLRGCLQFFCDQAVTLGLVQLSLRQPAFAGERREALERGLCLIGPGPCRRNVGLEFTLASFGTTTVR